MILKVTDSTGNSHGYSYNSQGSISSVRISNINRQISLDHMERVISFNGHNYEYDQDGYLVAKDDTKYQFNSQGKCELSHLVKNINFYGDLS